MNSSTKIATAALVLTCSAAYARAGYISLPTKVEQSELIATVEVLSTTQVVPYYEKSESGPGKFRALKPGEYRSQAQVKVLRSIKGLEAGKVYTLDFDNGLLCPNVWYKAGERCLVFNTKLPSGHYATYNTSFGKYTLEGDQIAAWKPGSQDATPLEDVAREITVLMQAPKAAE